MPSTVECSGPTQAPRCGLQLLTDALRCSCVQGRRPTCLDPPSDEWQELLHGRRDALPRPVLKRWHPDPTQKGLLRNAGHSCASYVTVHCPTCLALQAHCFCMLCQRRPVIAGTDGQSHNQKDCAASPLHKYALLLCRGPQNRLEFITELLTHVASHPDDRRLETLVLRCLEQMQPHSGQRIHGLRVVFKEDGAAEVCHAAPCHRLAFQSCLLEADGGHMLHVVSIPLLASTLFSHYTCLDELSMVTNMTASALRVKSC